MEQPRLPFQPQEVHEYRSGQSKKHSHIEEAYIRRGARPDVKMVGGYALFRFTEGESGTLIHDVTPGHVQRARQAQTFSGNA